MAERSNRMIVCKWPLLLVVLSVLAACDQSPQIGKFEGFTQGTTYHISYWSDQAAEQVQLESEVANELEAIDKTFSNYRPDSVIETFNNNPGLDSQSVGEEVVALFNVARRVSFATQGCYDLTIKPLFQMWGFQGDSLTIPAPERVQQALAEVGMDKVEVVDPSHLRKPPAVKVDVSSVAQGYSVEKISQVLERQGIRNYLVEIGGELKAAGHKPDGQPWRIAVEKPLPGEQRMMKVLTMPKQQPLAVMTSGTYRHYFDVDGRRYSHILDARNGRPVTHDLVAVTVLHDNPTVADAWSTALLCVGQEEGMRIADAEQLKVLFVQQQAEQLLETKSQALAASGLSIE